MSPEFRVRVETFQKPEILDPQTAAIESALVRKGHPVTDMQAGKFYDLTVTAESRDKVSEIVREFTAGFLANPTIEDYKIKNIRIQRSKRQRK